jgi:RNA polymerase sigma-70 factor (ECF subfamily)
VNQSNEAELLARAQKGDKGAFEVLVSRHYEKLTVLCQGVVFDHDLAQQAVQQALFNVWRNIGRCNENFAGWFYRAAINVARDMRSEAEWRKTIPLDTLPDTIRRDDPWPDAVVWGLQLDDILERLKPNEREIFILHHLLGLDLKEVAVVLEISHEAARQRWCRTKTTIRLMLDPGDWPDWYSQKGDDDLHP